MLKNSYLLITLSVIFLSIGQILFKKVSLQLHSLLKFQSVETIILFAVALMLYCVSTVMWLFSLKELELSKAYMLFSLAFILVPILSHYYFHEKYTIHNFIGGCFIILGVWVSTKT